MCCRRQFRNDTLEAREKANRKAIIHLFKKPRRHPCKALATLMAAFILGFDPYFQIMRQF